MKKIFIFGNGEFAELAKFYFEKDKKYSGIKISGFCVSDQFFKEKNFLNLPVVSISEVEKVFPRNEYKGFIAISYKKLNTVRKKIYYDLKNMGYKLENFISSDSHISDFQCGENCFILENQTIQKNVIIGNNVYLWSSNHIGHSSKIGDHTYISSHVCIGGAAEIGENCFFGVNSAVSDGIKIGNNVFVSMGVNVSKNINSESILLQDNFKEIKKEDRTYSKLKKIVLKNY